MRRTVTLINTATDRTGARGITRVNKFDYNSCQYRFVLDKTTQLSECPRVMLSPLAVSNRDSVMDTAQIFKSDTSASVFSLCNNTFGNSVIDIGSEASFFVRTFYKKSFGCLCAFGLEFATKFGLTLSEAVDLITGIRFAVGIGGDINDTEVNPQVTIGIIRSWFRSIYHNSKVKGTITENQVRLSNLTVYPSFLISADTCGDNLSADQSQNRDLIKPLPGKDTLVINHSRVGIERVLDFSIYLIALRDLGNCSYRHLCRESVVLTKIAINYVVKVELTIGRSLKSLTRCVVATFVESFHCLNQSFMLIWIRKEFNHQGLFHTRSVEYYYPHVKYLFRREVASIRP